MADKAFPVRYLPIEVRRFRCSVAGNFLRAKFPARHRGRELAGKCARIASETMEPMIRFDLGAMMAKPRGPLPVDQMDPQRPAEVRAARAGRAFDFRHHARNGRTRLRQASILEGRGASRRLCLRGHAGGQVLGHGIIGRDAICWTGEYWKNQSRLLRSGPAQPAPMP